MIKESTWVIIPARAGSKGLPNKNVRSFLGYPLIAHSIFFAKKLTFIDKILVSTDSEEYADIAKGYDAEVPFLRSKNAAEDDSMEEDILEDIIKKCKEYDIKPPSHIVWLRPTHPLRCLKTFEKAQRLYRQYAHSVCVVTEEDPRVFVGDEVGYIKPIIKEFFERSMVRRQELKPFYRIFHGEIFKMTSGLDTKFLGDKIRYVVQPVETKIDIDDLHDLEYAEKKIQKDPEKYEKFIHTN